MLVPIIFLCLFLTSAEPGSRRQCKYHITASEVIRPNTVYRVVVSAWECPYFPLRVTARLSSGGDRAVHSNAAVVTAANTPEAVLLSVPPEGGGGGGGGGGAKSRPRYILRVTGELESGTEVFREERRVIFRPQFLTVIISANKVVFNAEQPLRMRIVMLTTEGLPYRGTADLFLLDPDGFVVRKWNSQHLNVGVLLQTFQIPLYPKAI